MHAAQLRMAVTKIIDTLIRSDVKALVDQFRVAKDDQRSAAAARLGNAGATIVGRFDALSACLLYTSPSPRDQRGARMPSSA